QLLSSIHLYGRRKTENCWLCCSLKGPMLFFSDCFLDLVALQTATYLMLQEPSLSVVSNGEYSIELRERRHYCPHCFLPSCGNVLVETLEIPCRSVCVSEN